jgi:NAD(P)-dependent dehydrogenase (short-subunit alcohol dehydrogenase family)
VDLKLKDKCAIITGGSRGIGKAIARALAAEGVDVALVARDKAVCEASAAEITRVGGRRVLALQGDTGDDDSVRRMVTDVTSAFGRIDILVNCAAQPGGQSKPPALADVTNELFWADMNVKVMGYLRTAREVAPIMVKQGWGRIINISGLAARQTGTIIGSMRNVSVVALTKNLAEELGRKGINVTCVHPGLTRTEKTASVIERQAEAQGVSVQEIERKMADLNLIGKLLTAEEIAHVVVFLASPKSVAINGDVIATGGGTKGVIHY